jgi:hypothetical protein
MRDEIKERFEVNLSRVQSLIDLYGERAPQGGPGRRSVRDTDLLRAAVVLLHAALEDIVRSVTEWKLPQAGAEKFKGIALAGAQGERFSVVELVQHRARPSMPCSMSP